MKKSNLLRVMAACSIMAFTFAVAAVVGCEEPSGPSNFEGTGQLDGDSNPSNTGIGGGQISTQAMCNDGYDNEYDGFADRWGQPEHCTVKAPAQTTGNGSIIDFSASGYFSGVTPDTYTITVANVAPFQVTVTSALTGALGTFAVTNGVGINVPGDNVIIYFKDVGGVFQPAIGETWQVGVQRYTNCNLLPDDRCYHPDSVGETQCNNGLDDDNDGFADDLDPECFANCFDLRTGLAPFSANWDDESAAFTPECWDGQNNQDGDTAIDFPADEECDESCDISELY